MAGSKKKEKGKKKREKGKQGKHLSDQLEEKWVGSRTEVFGRISAKEAEIRSKTSEEKAKADRLIEDAKGQAAAVKRKATLEEIGKDVYGKMIATAKDDAGDIEASTTGEIAAVEKTGMQNLDKAVDFIVQAVVSSEYSSS